MLLRVFSCSPESARDREYRSYIARGRLPMFLLGPNPGQALQIIAVAAHVATIMKEGSQDVVNEFLAFVEQSFPDSGSVMVRGQRSH